MGCHFPPPRDLPGSETKASAWMRETGVRSLGWEDPLEKENGNPLQYSCLGNGMDGGARQAIVIGFAESHIRLND